MILNGPHPHHMAYKKHFPQPNPHPSLTNAVLHQSHSTEFLVFPQGKPNRVVLLFGDSSVDVQSGTRLLDVYHPPLLLCRVCLGCNSSEVSHRYDRLIYRGILVPSPIAPFRTLYRLEPPYFIGFLEISTSFTSDPPLPPSFPILWPTHPPWDRSAPRLLIALPLDPRT